MLTDSCPMSQARTQAAVVHTQVPVIKSRQQLNALAKWVPPLSWAESCLWSDLALRRPKNHAKILEIESPERRGHNVFPKAHALITPVKRQLIYSVSDSVRALLDHRRPAKCSHNHGGVARSSTKSEIACSQQHTMYNVYADKANSVLCWSSRYVPSSNCSNQTSCALLFDDLHHRVILHFGNTEEPFSEPGR